MSNRSIPVQFSVSGSAVAEVTISEYRDEVIAFGPGQNNPSEIVYQMVRFTITATLPFPVWLLETFWQDDALVLVLENQAGDEDDADLVIQLDPPYGQIDIRAVSAKGTTVSVIVTVTEAKHAAYC